MKNEIQNRSSSAATFLSKTILCAANIRYHVHSMAGRRPWLTSYVMVRVTSGASVNQSEWIVPGTLLVEG